MLPWRIEILQGGLFVLIELAELARMLMRVRVKITDKIRIFPCYLFLFLVFHLTLELSHCTPPIDIRIDPPQF